MCGIAGFVSLEPPASGVAVLERMTGTIVHRGPDASGFFHDGIAFLGHRRLSIVDLAAGQQPMTNEDGSQIIIFNGEIFNHAAVRPELEQAGHRYRTRSDTETLIHGYEQWGVESLHRFHGMFAFAIWDQHRKTLFAARDRLGKKPFYYYWDGRTFAFASEIKALLEHPAISAELEEKLLPEYLCFGYQSGEQTLFRGIRKLMPGHYLHADFSRTPALKIERYWNVPSTPAAASHSEEEWIRETHRRLKETVQSRLMADVPLGTFLSGGVDSSVITAMVKQLTGGPLNTFSVGYREAQYSELEWAAQVARLTGTQHHEVRVSREQFFATLPKLIWHEDEPITWPSSVSLYFVAQLAANHVKVVLTGEGSDELFAGYQRYRWFLWNRKASVVYDKLPGGVRGLVRSQIAGSRLLGADLRRKLQHTFLGRDSSVESLMLDNFYGAFSLAEQQRLLAASTPEAMYGSYLRYWREREGSPLLERLLYADQKTYLVELLMKQDQMSMAASIESRVPFLDHGFTSFAMSMPDSMKIRGSEQKYVLKKVALQYLPREIVYRTKMGFPTPLRAWLRDPESAPLLQALIAKGNFLGQYLNLAEVGSLIERHRSGLEDATDRLWRLINLEIWGSRFLRGQDEDTLAALASGARG